MNYVIAGGGIAAFSALKAIRAQDPAGRITVVSAEEDGFYYRPLTPLVVKGEKVREDLLPDPAAIGAAEVIRGEAAGLDASRRLLSLRGGGTVPYDRLLIATGSSPRVPDIPGVPGRNVHFLRTLADAETLRDAAREGAVAVVIGGGFVGVKAATALAHRGVRVTVVEKERQILLPRLDAAGASLVAGLLAAAGITLLTQETVAEILPEARGVRLASGSTLACDFVCVAVGVRPNIGWLEGSGVRLDQAVVVDERMQTSCEGIFAAGDCVQVRDPISGRPIVSALWTNAVQMGRVAGTNLAGGKAVYPGGPEVFNATEIEGLPVVSVGDVLAEEGGAREVFRRRRGPTYRKLVFDGDVLSGAIFAGDVTNAGVYTALIASRKPLGRLKEKAIGETLTYADVALPA
jgi:NAD(P)H-nitrite reductase large subunit